MSRTEKDTPWWTRGTWEAHHWRVGPHECDLPSAPPKRPVPWTWRTHANRTRCSWDVRTAQHPIGEPPKAFRDHVWNNPQRVRTRDLARQAIAEYRATGEVDVILPVDQHRHQAGWLWS